MPSGKSSIFGRRTAHSHRLNPRMSKSELKAAIRDVCQLRFESDIPKGFTSIFKKRLFEIAKNVSSEELRNCAFKLDIRVYNPLYPLSRDTFDSHYHVSSWQSLESITKKDLCEFDVVVVCVLFDDMMMDAYMTA